MLVGVQPRGEESSPWVTGDETVPLSLRAVCRYAVVWTGEEWRVITQQRRLGHFKRRASAWAVAVGLAREAETSGHPVELLLQQDEGDFELIPMYRSPVLNVLAAVASDRHSGPYVRNP